jgi:RNA polymerase sigma-70 factor (ECF subfamily)
MPIPDRLAERFEEHRGHLRAVAYRMLGSVGDAEDAVQEGWLRLHRAGADGVGNLRGWLTTVVARVCLDMLRARTARREEAFDLDVHVPDPIVTRADGQPEADVLLGDGIGLAMLVVLETLEPAERLAFVLHDAFGMTFDEIAPIVDRSPAAARQLASRARRRVRREAPSPDPDLRRQRGVVDAFLAAARDGDFERLVTVLDPEIVLRADGGAAKGMSRLVRGVPAFTAQAATFSRIGLSIRVVLVNGNLGMVSRLPDGRLFSVIGLTIAAGRIRQMDILADPERLARLDLPTLDG